MMINNGDYHISIIDGCEIPIIMEHPIKIATVYVITNQKETSEFTGKIITDIQNGVDIKSTALSYNYKHYEGLEEISELYDCNLLLLVPNLMDGRETALMASALPQDVGLAAVELIKESERLFLHDVDTFFTLVSYGNKELYSRGIDRYFQRLYHRRSIENSKKINFKARPPEGKIPKQVIVPNSTSNEIANEAQKISDNILREIYNNLPARYSDLYEKRNPEAAKILKQQFESIDRVDMVKLLYVIAREDRNILQKLYNTKVKIASNCGIEVKKWTKEQKKFFPEVYKYCVYFKNLDGLKIPIRFANHPSYAIFMMHILDRKNRGGDATALSYSNNRNEFVRLYQHLFNEDKEEIKEICDEFEIRIDPTTGRYRKGRYYDYLKDINETIEEILDSTESFVIKVGFGHYIAVPDNKIELDENLPKFQFA